MRTALFTDVGIYEACNNKVRYCAYHTTRGSPLYPLIVLYNVENYCG
eukprot:COSAG01_NODE_3596_length_5895_cov_13.108351_3_plen_47_part_00